MARPRDLCSPARGPVSISPAVTGPSLAPSPRGRYEPLASSDQRGPCALGPEGWSGSWLQPVLGIRAHWPLPIREAPALPASSSSALPAGPQVWFRSKGHPPQPRKARGPVLQTKGRLPEASKEPLSADHPSRGPTPGYGPQPRRTWSHRLPPQPQSSAPSLRGPRVGAVQTWLS